LGGYGPDNAREHLKKVLNEYNPCFAGMTGVCAGDKRKKVKLGDLVLARCAFMYDDAMISEDPQQQRQQDVELYYTNVDSKYFHKVWKQLEMKQEPPLHSKLYIAPMACVTTVRRDNPFHKIQTLVHDAIAIDMEGASFYSTVSSFSKSSFSGLHSLVVKGVCDYADSDKNDERHEDASKGSAEYMICFIKEYVTSDLAPAFLLSADH
jgi:nucleoside phosphorylase